MSLCAYELDVELDVNLTELKQELIEFNNNWPNLETTTKTDAGCYSCVGKNGQPINDGNMFYVPVDFFIKQQGSKHITQLMELFNNSFLSNMRFMTLYPNQYLGWHTDSDKQPEGYYSDIPNFMVTPTQLNILLSTPMDDVTEFAYDTKLTKYNWCEGGNEVPQHYGKYNESGFKTVDKFIIKQKPAIINTGVWHSVQPSKDAPRIIASLTFWPLITFDNVVDFCRNEGLLIER